jgi:hypothetical protein
VIGHDYLTLPESIFTYVPGLLFILTFILCVELISCKLLIIGVNQGNFLKIWQQRWLLRLWFSKIAGQVV